MDDYPIGRSVQALKKRHVDSVGFVNKLGGGYRPDAACWAIIALRAALGEDQLIQKARKQLAMVQAKDGRVCVSPEHPDAYWPTPLAILAWQASTDYKKEQSKAVKFLLDFSEIQNSALPEHIFGHDGTIKGWPWIARTNSWVEPTALALIALQAVQLQTHERAQDAVRLLMDRQLPNGGWNYGKTFVFGQQLRAIPIPTGISLQSLSGLVAREKVEKSILYLRSQLEHAQTPFTLAWTLLGLNAWREAPRNRNELVLSMLQKNEKIDCYDTVSLGALIVAYFCKNGFSPFFQHFKQMDQKQ